MDDLIVVILTLIFAGIGAYGQINKKKKLAVEPEKSKIQEDFWDLFNQNTFFENQTKKTPQPTEVFVEETGPAINEQGYSFKAADEGGSMIEADKQELKRIVRKSGLKENFSLKQAVIYNEILNRKYF
jgi:hypothetical protein